ncbi:GNAT family N-acetyltransferase [Antarctobacter sp.]|uniref:GNAT family N-acetyltransferase n=1 Tax=Antarctobacter sp. TaxID=1872577 RepID=UPI002B26D24A|nr:GNAT family N-acetyltransferase [Antarctobacter sp.]
MIEEISEQCLTVEDEAEISALLEVCFPTDYGGRSFFKQRPHLRVIWREARIVGHVALFYRAVRLGDALVDVIGVGDVATLPEARGKGIGTQLIDRSAQTGRNSQAEFLLLFGARGLYDRAGFRPVTNPYRHVQMEGARTQGIEVRTSQFLKVRSLHGSAWPEGVEVDFLGPLP